MSSIKQMYDTLIRPCEGFMSIDGVSCRTSYIGTSILNIRKQLDDLTQQLASGGFEYLCGAGRQSRLCAELAAQVSGRIPMRTREERQYRLNVANLALQGLSDIGTSVKAAAGTSTIVLNNNGQTSGQITAQAAFSNAVSLLNSQTGDRYLFSGRTTDTAATVSADVMLDGVGTQAGLKQLINERRQADQGVSNMGHLTVASPPATTTVTGLTEDGSSFGLKLGTISSSLRENRDAQPARRRPSPRSGAVIEQWRQITFNFNLRRHHRVSRDDCDDDDPPPQARSTVSTR